MALIQVYFSHEQRIAHIVLNRPEKANALTQVMWEQLEQAVIEASALDGIRALVLESASEKAFSAGADIAELRAMINDPARLSANHLSVQRASLALDACVLPTLAVIRGACVGGGLGLALACDFRIADSSARFALTPAKLGLSYSLNDTRRLQRIVGPSVARRMLLLGEPLDALEATRVGLIETSYAPGDLLSKSTEFLDALACASPFAMRTIKATLQRIERGQLEDDADTRAEFAAAFNAPDFIHAAGCFINKQPISF